MLVTRNYIHRPWKCIIYAKYSHVESCHIQMWVKGVAKSEVAVSQELAHYRGALIEHRLNHQYVTCAP